MPKRERSSFSNIAAQQDRISVADRGGLRTLHRMMKYGYAWEKLLAVRTLASMDAPTQKVSYSLGHIAEYAFDWKLDDGA